ncbi:LytTR family transcriptional regulator DNA-binding domain-containing protein [Spirosoma pollinicola]|uniref:HTH LytTR-type domain-containing protein n=1 Tax=Spirosoma pollinicola TaxID=2057025 RepID=A0A2K8ZA73_9BACT|nr:LytTR family transcriptional regulator DNA-binding domain-containing protein [Spirosoma pollinicola]AUD06745.1 hypothetical protein CWM47_35820 [Spirosoma pollinicola]
MIKLRIDWKRPVAYVSGDENYTTLHYPDGSTLLVAYTVSWVTTKLNLLRIHNRISVNRAYVYGWIRHDARTMAVGVTMSTFIKSLEVARRRVAYVEEQLSKPS